MPLGSVRYPVLLFANYDYVDKPKLRVQFWPKHGRTMENMGLGPPSESVPPDPTAASSAKRAGAQLVGPLNDAAILVPILLASSAATLS